MKTILVMFLSLIFLSSCKKNDSEDSSTSGKVNVTTIDVGHGTVTGVHVDLVLKDGNDTVQSKDTDSNGKVTFKDVLPDTYYIHCYSDVDHIAYSDNFQVIAGKTKNITVDLP